MKKIICLFIALLILLPASLVSAEDTPTVAERLQAIMELYPSGSYFTKNGKACTDHPSHSSFSCANCKTVTAEEAGTEGNMQCFGFARAVFYQLFGLPYPHYDYRHRWRPKGDEMANVNQVWWAEPGFATTEEVVRQAFGAACLGDVVHSGLPHSMIFVEAHEDGILVYDANYDMYTCQVLLHEIGWAELVKWCVNYGMSIYRAANYPNLAYSGHVDPPVYESSHLEVVFMPENPYLYEGMRDFTGLTLYYEKGGVTAQFTCLGGGEFKSEGSFENASAFVNGDDGFGLRIRLSAGEPGSMTVELLDASVTVECDVEEGPGIVVEKLVFPEKREYFIGEQPDFSGAALSYRAGDGSFKELTEDELDFQGFDTSRAGVVEVLMGFEGLDPLYSFRIYVRDPAQETAPVSSGNGSPDVTESPFTAPAPSSEPAGTHPAVYIGVSAAIAAAVTAAAFMLFGGRKSGKDN